MSPRYQFNVKTKLVFNLSYYIIIANYVNFLESLSKSCDEYLLSNRTFENLKKVRPTNKLLKHQDNIPEQCIPPKPHFYIVKLGFAWVSLFF